MEFGISLSFLPGGLKLVESLNAICFEYGIIEQSVKGVRHNFTVVFIIFPHLHFYSVIYHWLNIIRHGEKIYLIIKPYLPFTQQNVKFRWIIFLYPCFFIIL